MKRLVTLLAIVLFSFSSFAQDLTNQFYFRVGYSSPSWSQYGFEKDDWGSGASKTGATFDIGSIFLFRSILPTDNMALGINVDYLYLNYHNFSGDEGGYEQNLGAVRLGSKVGPSFTFSPIDKMAFDVYVKADISWATVNTLYEDDVNDADDYFTAVGTVGLSTGLNFRYGLLIVGIEYNTISPKLESDDYPDLYFQEMLDEEMYISGAAKKKSKLPCMNFTIGMSF